MDYSNYSSQNFKSYSQKNSHEAGEKELARSYVPFQTTFKLFSPEEALIKGTVFSCLYKPHYCEYTD